MTSKNYIKHVLIIFIIRETLNVDLEMLRNFGLKMGIRAGVMDQMLLKMNEYEDHITPSEELMKIIQTYYN